LADVTTGGPLFPTTVDAFEDSAGPSLVQATPAKDTDKHAARRRICAESKQGKRVFAIIFMAFTNQGTGRGADSPAHDLFLTTPGCFLMASVSLMDPADKAAELVR
jgi:hypothetical protein